jgi:uncharacterized protein
MIPIDPVLKSIVQKLKSDHNCHTVILYGSRARGLATATSDYDVIGVTRRGPKDWITKKQNGYFWDVFVYAEKDLRKLGDRHFAWKNARLLYENGPYGRTLLKKIETHLKKPFKPHPKFEIAATKTWAQKELERCRADDIQGLYRRAEFQAVLIEHYFFIRQKRFPGPKEAFAWITKNDLKTYKLIRRALKNPANLAFLKSAASRVYKTTLF